MSNEGELSGQSTFIEKQPKIQLFTPKRPPPSLPSTGIESTSVSDSNYLSRRKTSQQMINEIENKKKEIAVLKKIKDNYIKEGKSTNANKVNELIRPIQSTINDLDRQLQLITARLTGNVEKIPEQSRELLNDLLFSINEKIEQAYELMPNIVSDWQQHINKSPLSYLIYTNKSLISKAQEEFSNIKSFTETRKTRQPVLYKLDAKFPQTTAPKSSKFAFWKKGGSAKTVRNRKRA